MANKPQRVLLGKIATAHGVRGLVKILVLADDPHALDRYGPLFTSADGDKTFTLKMKNSLGAKGGKFWLAEVAGIPDRTEAEKLRGTELWLDRHHLPKIDKPDGFYVEDLNGLQVRDEAGNGLGKIIAVENFGAGDLLEIQPVSGESFYLPFIKDNIQSVDLAAGHVTVALPEGIGND